MILKGCAYRYRREAPPDNGEAIPVDPKQLFVRAAHLGDVSAGDELLRACTELLDAGVSAGGPDDTRDEARTQALADLVFWVRNSEPPDVERGPHRRNAPAFDRLLEDEPLGSILESFFSKTTESVRRRQRRGLRLSRADAEAKRATRGPPAAGGLDLKADLLAAATLWADGRFRSRERDRPTLAWLVQRLGRDHPTLASGVRAGTRPSKEAFSDRWKRDYAGILRVGPPPPDWVERALKRAEGRPEVASARAVCAHLKDEGLLAELTAGGPRQALEVRKLAEHASGFRRDAGDWKTPVSLLLLALAVRGVRSYGASWRFLLTDEPLHPRGPRVDADPLVAGVDGLTNGSSLGDLARLRLPQMCVFYAIASNGVAPRR